MSCALVGLVDVAAGSFPVASEVSAARGGLAAGAAVNGGGFPQGGSQETQGKLQTVVCSVVAPGLSVFLTKKSPPPLLSM